MNLWRAALRLLGRAALRPFGLPNAEFEQAVARARESPDSTAPLTRPELIAALRALADRTPQTKEELILLEADSLILSERIGKSPGLDNVPELVWHFLTDADVRFKEPLYRAAQLEALERWIRET